MSNDMKKLLFLSTVMLMLLSCGVASNSQQSTTKKQTIRVGTYNLWVTGSGKGDNLWALRKDRLAQSIADIDFDVFGAQEVDLRHQKELPALLRKHGAAEYSWYIFSPYSPDGVGDKAQAILYKKSRFKLIRSHHFWISETPDTISSGWDETKYIRGGCALILKDKNTGRKFMFMNSHFPLGKIAKVHAAEIVNAQAQKFNRDNLPAFFVGDLNTSPKMKGAEIARTYWKDAYLTIPAGNKEGSRGTFNSRKPDTDMSKAKRIDYIYYRGKMSLLKYCCFNKKYDGFYPSDHCAVYVDAIL